jgi:hypothetical protein
VRSEEGVTNLAETIEISLDQGAQLSINVLMPIDDL